MRTWQVERRKRTRHLIELGGLVVKAGIVDLTGDDRTMIYGALLWMADKLQSDQGERMRVLWIAKGKQAFENGSVTPNDTPPSTSIAVVERECAPSIRWLAPLGIGKFEDISCRTSKVAGVVGIARQQADRPLASVTSTVNPLSSPRKWLSVPRPRPVFAA
ncbi:conjugal transfer protein TraD [Bradyrhizobium sp. SZCCHNS3002]|uniref:conjugal transfer protein TraD n=1 Tax=Bradyrhizobium sp. SZCCHNS3002 TaxID=3057310 RepID=UPI0028E52EEA|nr:conjugal transfer protein TraD [Bradyrhizobium sp. SZCCHNS3002]